MKRLVLSIAVVLSCSVAAGTALSASRPAPGEGPSGEKSGVAKTAEQIRILATAMEAYAVDNNAYPAGTLDDLEKALSPTYVEKMPRLDAWETPLRVETSKDRMNYRITSAGSDKGFEARGPVGCPADKEKALDLADDRRDLVYYNGEFVQLVK